MSCFVGSIFDSLRGMVAGILREEARFGDAVGLDLRESACVLEEIDLKVGRLLFSVALGPPPPPREAMTVRTVGTVMSDRLATLVRPWTNI